MGNFKVKSGSLKANVTAGSHKMAAMKAIDENEPESLGMIMSVLKEGDEENDEIYFKTTYILDSMGFEVEG